MIDMFLRVTVFVVLSLPRLSSHYLCTLTSLFRPMNISQWLGSRHTAKDPQPLDHFSTVWWVFHLFLISTECWNLGLRFTGRPDSINALERSVTLGQPPERQEKVMAFGRAPHRRAVGRCSLCVGPRSSSLSIRSPQLLPGVMEIT